MTDRNFYHALTEAKTPLARRYNVMPHIAAVAHDAGEPWEVQLRNRKQLAWQDVRRIGHAVAFESRMLLETNDVHHFDEWCRLRRELAWYLECWRRWRDALGPKDMREAGR